jgi:cyd operon protein YbgT
MWYFSWILGIGVALGFGIINVMWLEANGTFSRDAASNDLLATPVDNATLAAGSTTDTH